MSSFASRLDTLSSARLRAETVRRLGTPLAVVAAVAATLLTAQLAIFHGNLAGLVNFGWLHVSATHPPAGTPVLTPDGYDGQLYWIQAHDPLLLHRATVARLAQAYPGYYLQRPAFPLLVFLLSGGQTGLLPMSMLTLNLGCLLALTLVVSRWAMSHGRSPWWGAAIGLMPGVLMPVLRDLSDILAVSTMLMGLIAWRSGRRWAAAALLAVAVLAREPMTLAVAAIGVEAVVDWWRTGHGTASLRRVAHRAWPTLLIPTLAFFGWQAYIHLDVQRLGAGVAQASTAPVTSLVGYAGELKPILAAPLTAHSAWDLLYLGLMVVASLLAVVRLRRGVDALGVSAVLSAALLLFILFGDAWGEARYSAPLFGALMLGAIERRSRPTTIIAVLLVGLSLLVPYALL